MLREKLVDDPVRIAFVGHLYPRSLVNPRLVCEVVVGWCVLRIQRLRDEAHRFVIGSHRKLRKKDIREAGLQEIPGIGPSRKRALLHHFGALKEIERASIADPGKVPGVSAESARKIFEYFHSQPN